MYKALVVSLSSCSLSILSACGGGGGGGSTNSTPTPPPPPPTNSSLANLQYSQSFTNDAAVADTQVVNTSSALTSSSSTGKETLTVSYDASTQSYTLRAGATTQTFNPSDKLAPRINGIDEFKKGSGANLDYFFHVQSTTNGFQYVSLGEWQHGGQTDLNLRFFTYGVTTPANAAPKTGGAGYKIAVSGLYSPIGSIPKSASGSGTFYADFKSGLFSTNAYLEEDDVIGSGGQASFLLTGGGGLSSSAGGGFSGNVTYSGSRGPLAGQMDGRFYGPGAEEVGAAFHADAADGSTLAGALIGTSKTGDVAVQNLALSNMVTNEHFYAPSVDLIVDVLASTGAVRPDGLPIIQQDSGSFDYDPTASFTVGPVTSLLPTAPMGPADLTSSTGNFTTYQKTVNGTPVEVRLYKTGSSNSELALTYVSFGIWKGRIQDPVYPKIARDFFTYGFETPASTLSRRTGTAHYDGVIYGAAVNVPKNAIYDVNGTSVFDMNFGAQTYAGSLTMKGTNVADATQQDFGRFDFSGSSFGNNNFSGVLTQGGVNTGSINTKFYGPDGEELAATFRATVPSGVAAQTLIGGIAVAKRH